MSLSIRVANAPISWGISEDDEPASRPPFGQVMDEMAAAGYEGTELGPYGYLPTDPGVLRDALQKRGLALLSAFVPVPLHDPARLAEGTATALEVARLIRALGCQAIVLAAEKTPDRIACAGRVRLEDGLSQEGWRHAARAVEQIALRCHEEFGLAAHFHHHAATVVETEAEIDRLMELTSPDLLGLCLDTGHCAFGGGDPSAVVHRHGPRVRYFHVKDCARAVLEDTAAAGGDYFDAVRAGVFPPLGRGSVDFPAFFQALDARDYSGWCVVEADRFGDDPAAESPAAGARASRQYLRQVGGF